MKVQWQVKWNPNLRKLISHRLHLIENIYFTPHTNRSFKKPEVPEN